LQTATKEISRYLNQHHI